jgi:molybdopterin synthase catalytic subunit
MRKLSVQSEDFDLSEEMRVLTTGRTDIGAVVSFTGLCRSEGGTLSALELEHFPGMAEQEISRLMDEAETRWSLQALCVIHRYGRIEPGGQIVLVMTASAHRQAAFEAADFLMDYLKTRAPFWKKEWQHTGSSRGWVAAKSEDDVLANRWISKDE